MQKHTEPFGFLCLHKALQPQAPQYNNFDFTELKIPVMRIKSS